MDYNIFASQISFYEFIQDEYHKNEFPINNYQDEIKALKQGISIEHLVTLLSKYPKIFDIMEHYFQISRFSNTQYIHFLFDVTTLNNSERKQILAYANKSMFVFENNVENILFRDIYDRITPRENDDEKIVLKLKRTIPIYIEKCIKKRTCLYNHIKNSLGSRLRISKYLIINLMADEHVSNIAFDRVIELKRIPKDTKGLHGKYGTLKIKQIFSIYGIEDFTSKLPQSVLLLESPIKEASHLNYCYVREKYIEGINVRKTGRPKKFDFIILIKGKPYIAIETNFYTTSGTKIGINVGEYTDLYEDIKKKQTELSFCWISDGNYWLTKEGENRFHELKTKYFINDNDILNYNTFKLFLSELLKKGA